MNLTEEQIERLTQVIHIIGFEVTDIYENLVFIADNPFVLKVVDHTSDIEVYFNEELEEERAEEFMAMIAAAGEQIGLNIDYKGAFCMRQNKDETLSLEFFNLTQD